MPCICKGCKAIKDDNRAVCLCKYCKRKHNCDKDCVMFPVTSINRCAQADCNACRFVRPNPPQDGRD